VPIKGDTNQDLGSAYSGTHLHLDPEREIQRLGLISERNQQSLKRMEGCVHQKKLG
jgi:hypothetical protein